MDLGLFSTIAKAMFSGGAVTLPESKFTVKVTHTPNMGLRKVAFNDGSRTYLAIEQNPAKGSRWALLARSGKQVVQFKDAVTDHYVAVAVDGKVEPYGIRK